MMTRFVTFCLLVLFTAALNAQDPIASEAGTADVATKTKSALKDVVSEIVKDDAGLNDADVLNEVPPTTLDNPQTYQGEIVYADQMHGEMVYGVPVHGEFVQGPTYQSAPHVAYGAALGSPAYRQIPNGPLYNGPTWGLFPKYHRLNKPRPIRDYHQQALRPNRFFPTGWRR